MSDPSVSDVDQDDIDQMIKGIDDFDDNLFGKQKKPISSSQKQAVTNPEPAEVNGNGNGKKVKFQEEDNTTAQFDPNVSGLSRDKEEKSKPPGKQLDFDDDDILGSLENKPKAKTANVMDDLFGSKDTKDKNSFMDDIFGAKPTNKNDNFSSGNETKDFILDSKYKKKESDSSYDVGGSRRRRGNPTVEPVVAAKNGDIFNESKKTYSVPNEPVTKSNSSDNPFPWMSTNNTSKPEAPAGVADTPIQSKSEAPVPVRNPSQSIVMSQLPQSQPAIQHLPVQANMELSDTKQQDLFNREIEMQTKLLNDRKVEYAAALEKHRHQVSDQFAKLQNKQSQVNISKFHHGSDFSPWQ